MRRISTTVATTPTSRWSRISIVFSASVIPIGTGTTSIDYLNAVGNGMQPYQYEGTPSTLKEVNDFALVLGAAIAANDKDVVALAVDTIGNELRELTEFYPDRKDTSVSGGENERALARQALKEQVLTLRRIDIAAAAGRMADAAADYEAYRDRMVGYRADAHEQCGAVVAVHEDGA